MSQQMRDRLARSTEAYAMAQELVEDERRRRNELILDARREGMSYGEIAHATGVSRARVMQVIGETA